jgi:hypothetical protein
MPDRDAPARFAAKYFSREAGAHSAIGYWLV